MSTPTAEIHGHEVMQMMVDSGKAYDAASLEADIHAKFGASARFCTCSASGMTARELIQFLAERGKFIPQSRGFTIDSAKICDHEN